MNFVTMHFVPEPFLRVVNERLEARGLLRGTVSGGEARTWHQRAWHERFSLDGPLGAESSTQGSDDEVILPALGTIDRVFVSPQPVREILRYLRRLDALVTTKLREFPPGSIILYARMPHYPWEIVFARRAEASGHRVLVINNIYVNDRVTLEEGTDFFRPALRAADRLPGQGPIKRIDLESAHFESTKKLNRDSPRVSQMVWWLKLFTWVLFPNSRLGLLRRVALNRKNQSIFSRSELLRALRKLLRQKRAISKLLDQIEISSIDTRRFVLVALHYQPEATTDPAGGSFADQAVFVRQLRDVLDRAGYSDIEVLVREHPRQIARAAPALGESGFRSAPFYIELDALPGVSFVSRSISMSELIERSTLVATVNGTAAWEALRAGRPAITGRRTWYGDCAAVGTIEEIGQKPEDLAKLLSLDPEEVRSALEAFFLEERVTFPGSNDTADLSVSRDRWITFAETMIDEILRRIHTSVERD